MTYSTAATLDLCHQLAKKCDFYFHGNEMSVPRLNVKGRPDKPMNGLRIASRKYGDNIGLVNSNGVVPELVFMKNNIPITNYGMPPYSASTLKPYKFRNTNRSGIGHQSFAKWKQVKFIRYRCVRLYITAFQVISADGQISNNVNEPPADDNCIVFRTIWAPYYFTYFQVIVIPTIDAALNIEVVNNWIQVQSKFRYIFAQTDSSYKSRWVGIQAFFENNLADR